MALDTKFSLKFHRLAKYLGIYLYRRKSIMQKRRVFLDELAPGSEIQDSNTK